MGLRQMEKNNGEPFHRIAGASINRPHDDRMVRISAGLRFRGTRIRITAEDETKKQHYIDVGHFSIFEWVKP